MKKAIGYGLLLAALATTSARAEDTFKIGFIDPLSGPGATAGEVGLKTWQFLADEVNKKGGINGHKVEIVPYDNKLNPQETTIQAQKAIDAGMRLLVRSNGGAPGAALNEFLNKFNERNPTKQTIYFDFSGTDPVLTNEKCSYWQIRWADNVDMKDLALIDFMKTRGDSKKVYLLNGDYSTGQGVRAATRANLKDRLPGVEITGDDLFPLMKVTDFAPYIEKIKASGADTVITSAWGQDLALILKAAGEAGSKAKWYTFFGQGIGSPTAIRQSGLPPHAVFQIYEAMANVPSDPYRDEEKRFRAFVGEGQTIMYPVAVSAMQAFTKAAEELKTLDVVKIMAKLDTLHYTALSGGNAWVRPEDHQAMQRLYVASFGPKETDQPFDEEGTGWGWKVISQVDADKLVLPTTCKMKRPT